MTSSDASSARLDRLVAFLEHDAGNVALRTDAVCEAFGTGQWETARKLIDAGLQTDPRQAKLLALSGFAHLQSGRYDDAEHALSAALAQGLNAPEVRYNLAFAHFMNRRYTQALELLADPVPQAVPLALLLRARCLHHLQRAQEAMADCRAHLVAAPDDADTHGLLGLLLQEQNRNEEAKDHIDAALRQQPKQLDAMLASAAIQADARHYDAAGDSFAALLEAHPNCGRAWHGLAMIELGHMRLEPAKRHIELAAAHMPEHIGTWHVLAWIQLLQGDVASAGLTFERCMAMDRTFGETHGGLAVVAALQGHEEAARASIKRALRLDQQSLSAQYAQMLLLQRDGKHSEAQAILDAVQERRLARGDTSIRDMVATHIGYLQARASDSPDAQGIRP